MKIEPDHAALAAAHAGHIKPFLAALLAAFGIMIEPQVFFAGILLALAGAYIAAHWFPEKDKHELWQVLILAVFVAFLMAILHDHILPEIPAQFKMALGGFGSRLIIRGAWQAIEKKVDDGGENAD